MDKENNFSKRREKELAEDTIVLEKAIKNFWEILPIPVCTASPIFIILETGKGFDTLFGYIKNELVGESLKEIAFDKDSFKKFLANSPSKEKFLMLKRFLKIRREKKYRFLFQLLPKKTNREKCFPICFRLLISL